MYILVLITTLQYPHYRDNIREIGPVVSMQQFDDKSSCDNAAAIIKRMNSRIETTCLPRSNR